MTIDPLTREHIEKMVCIVHDVHPIIEANWDGIKLICCCEQFEKVCLLTAENLVLKTELNQKSSSQ
jgi:hypothetical protein